MDDCLAYSHDGSFEGFLTCVFRAFEMKELPADIESSERLVPRLGQSVREIETDMRLAARVRAGVIRACGRTAFNAVKSAFLSDDPSAGAAILGFIVYAMRRGARAMSDIGRPEVDRMLSIARSVDRERHRMLEFIRFIEVEGGVYCATCSPKANVVPLLMDWFAERFNTQPFIIYDKRHRMAGAYDGSGWYLVRSDSFTIPEITDDERVVSAAWKAFYDSVSIESRYNPELRTQLVPKRFQADMTEFQEEWERKVLGAVQVMV